MDIQPSVRPTTDATTTTVVPAAQRGLQRSSLLQRGEALIASTGIALAAILLATMAAAGYWMQRQQRASADRARTEQVKDVATMLSQAGETLMAQNELSALRRLVVDAGRTYHLSRCQIVLPGDRIVASTDASQINAITIPAKWSERIAPTPLQDSQADGAESAGTNTIYHTQSLRVPGRGAAFLQIAAAPVVDAGERLWEAQTGAGGIGAVALLALWLVYRRTRGRLQAMSVIREALLSPDLLTAGGADAAAGTGVSLLISADLGAEAVAWNELIGDRERLRKETLAERARQSLGRRGRARGDLDAACDAMSQGLLLVDERACVKYANGAAAAFLRLDRDRLVGTEIHKALQIEKIVSAIRDVASGKLRRRTVIDIERSDDAAAAAAAASAADGSNGTAAGRTFCSAQAGVLRFSIRPVRREDSASAMVVIEDITQQKAAEEARHAFVAQATHELRTPLTNIRLYVETAIDEGEKDPATRSKCLNVINGEARRLERIVGEMLSVAEIEAGSFALVRDDVRLDALFEELAQDYQRQAKEKRIALTFALSPKLPVLRGDRAKVMMAMQNLVGNALKYTPEGGSVTVQVDADERSATIAVRDTGIGISADDCERIFERFCRANDERVAKITGSGLGLTLAREVARLHGGDVTVESQLNHGSTFTLVLPVQAAA